jgi:hypothetical protein
VSISKDLDKETLREIIAGAKSSLEQMLAMALLKAEEELERLRAQEPVAYYRQGFYPDGSVFCTNYLTSSERQDRPLSEKCQDYGWSDTPLYAEPKPPVAQEPSLQAMMAALDAFYAEEDVPENGMFAAFKILLNDCRAAMLQSPPVVSLPPEFCSSEGVVVQLEKVISALAVHGIKYERQRGNAGAITVDRNSFTDAELEMMSHGNNPQSNAYRELLEYRRNSPVIPDGWVPCSERMPEVYVTVNFFVADDIEEDVLGGCYNGYWDGDLWHQDATLTGHDESPIVRNEVKVTHWMPLPAAPEVK